MAAEEEVVERKEPTERRVYALPASLLVRLRAFQESQGIGSEAEAARRLLDTALQLRDGVTDILRTLQTKFAEEKDLRVLAGEVLAKHVLVTRVSFSDFYTEFELRDGDKGRISYRGALSWFSPMFGNDDTWTDWPVKPRPRPKTASISELDEEIPF